MFVCFDDQTTYPDTSDCQFNDQHTPAPRGYIAQSAWAEEMLETHERQECPGCGKLKIWTPKEQP